MRIPDFEKPIEELSSKINGLIEKEGNEKEINELKKELTALKKKIYKELTPWQRVQISRHPNRPYTLDYILAMATNFIELHGDRRSYNDPAIIGGFANLEGQSVMMIGHQKGRDTKERQFRNFGMASPEGYRKAMRLMKLAEKFNKPVITFIDTPGASPGSKAEEHGQAEAIGANIQEMLKLKVPVIAVIIGEGTSGGAMGLSTADQILMLEYAWFTVISPEVGSSLLFKDWKKSEETAKELKLTACDLKEQGIIDHVIKEPLGGAHKDPKKAFRNLKKELVNQLEILGKMSSEERIDQRVEKYTGIGVFQEV